jgi:hypothetical protein
MEDSTPKSNHFELVFEGPVDDSLETMRKLRASLLADLGLSVSEAQEVLSSTPATVKTAEVEDDLQPLFAALKKAGGKVLIVRPASAADSDDETDPFDPKVEEPEGYFLDIESSNLSDELLMSLHGLDTNESEPQESEPDNEKAYALDLEDAADVELPSLLEKAAPALRAGGLADKPQALPEADQKEVHSNVPPPSETTPALTPQVASEADYGLDLTLEETAPAVAAAISPQAPSQKPSLSAIRAELFKLDDEPTESEKAPASHAVVSTESAPIQPLTFEFASSAEATPNTSKATAPSALSAPPAPSAPFAPLPPKPGAATLDFGLELAPEEAVLPKAAEPVKKTTQAEDFSSDALSAALALQTESPAASKTAPKPAPAPAAKPKSPEPKTSALQVEVSAIATEAPQPVPVVSGKSEVAHQPAPQHAHQPTQAVAENTEVAAVPRVRTKSTKQNVLAELMLPIAIGALVLGVANWIYFAGDGGIASISFEIPDEKPAELSVDALRGQRTAAKEPVSAGQYSSDQFSLNWTVHFDGKLPLALSLEVQTPPVAELTPEEIVRKVSPRLWVKKIEIVRVPLTKLADGRYGVNTQGRVFIEKGNMKKRGPAEIIARVRNPEPGKSAELELLLQRGFGASALPRFSLEEIAQGDVRIAVAGTFE